MCPGSAAAPRRSPGATEAGLHLGDWEPPAGGGVYRNRYDLQFRLAAA